MVTRYEVDRRHAQYYLSVLQNLDDLYEEGQESVESILHQYDSQYNQIDKGQAWAKDHADKDETCGQLVSAYHNAGVLLEYLSELRKRVYWLENALAKAQQANQYEKVRKYLHDLGSAYLQLGQHKKAKEYFQKSKVKRPLVFLSYSRRDTDIMHRLHSDLATIELDIWTDQNLEPGTPAWVTEIQKAIENSGGFIVVLSPDAKTSEWVAREIAYAQECNVKIFPVLALGDVIQSIPLSVMNMVWTDIRSDYASGLRKLVGALCTFFEING